MQLLASATIPNTAKVRDFLVQFGDVLALLTHRGDQLLGQFAQLLRVQGIEVNLGFYHAEQCDTGQATCLFATARIAKRPHF